MAITLRGAKGAPLTIGELDANFQELAANRSADTIVDGTNNKVLTAAEKSKLAGIAAGATANRADIATDALIGAKLDAAALSAVGGALIGAATQAAGRSALGLGSASTQATGAFATSAALDALVARVAALEAGGGGGGGVSTMKMGLNLSGGGSAPDQIPGAEFTNYAWPDNAAFAYAKSRGASYVRIDFIWERVQPTLGGALDAAYLGRMKDMAALATANGLTILWDMHNYMRRRVSGTERIIGHTDGVVTRAHYADAWGKLAAELKSLPATYAYGIMNEPHDLPSATLWPLAAQAAVDAIVAQDAVTKIYVAGDGWSSAELWTSNNATLNITHPTPSKVIYEIHQYNDANSSGAYSPLSYDAQGATATNYATRIQNAITWAQNNGRKLAIGECGVPDVDDRWVTSLVNMFQAAKDSGVIETIFPWTYCPWFGPNYELQLAPEGNKDRRSMAAITKFGTGGTSPNLLFMDGPGLGATSTASTPFTVEYRGVVDTAFTVTPSATGGGTFSPASITIPVGVNGKGTFTYTPASDGTKTISITNTGGKTNPGPIGYAASSGAQPDAVYALNLTSPTFAAGKFSQGLSGGGATATDNPTYAAINGGAFTIECWFKAPTDQTASKWLLRQNGSFALGVANNVTSLSYVTPDNQFPFISSSVAINDGAYHHAAFTGDGSGVTLWVDGVAVGNASGPMRGFQFADFQIREFGDNPGNNFTGVIDEIRVSNVVRYTGPFTPPTAAFDPTAANTRVVYHFDGTGAGYGSTAASPPVVQPVALTLTEPTPRTYQRTAASNRTTAPVAFSVASAGNVSSIEARVVNFDTDAQVSPWTAVLGASAAGTYPLTLTVPASAARLRLQVRANGGAAVPSTTWFQVGDVLAFWGQSQINRMFGYNTSPGGLTADAPFRHALGIGNDGPTIAPQWREFDTADTTFDGGFLINLHNRVRALTGFAVGFVGSSTGATTAADFDVPGTDGPATALRTALDLCPDFLALYGLIGGSDIANNTPAATYKSQLTATDAWLRARYTHSFPHYIQPQWGRTSGTESSVVAIRAAQLELISQLAGAAYPYTGVDIGLNDGIHQNDAGNQRASSRFARSIGKQLGLIPNGAEGPSLVSAVRSGAVITLTFAHSGGTGLVNANGSSPPQNIRLCLAGSTTAQTGWTFAVTGANTATITLASTPATSQAYDIHASYGVGVLANGLNDNQTIPGDTIGLPVRHTLAPVTVAALT